MFYCFFSPPPPPSPCGCPAKHARETSKIHPNKTASLAPRRPTSSLVSFKQSFRAQCPGSLIVPTGRPTCSLESNIISKHLNSHICQPEDWPLGCHSFGPPLWGSNSKFYPPLGSLIVPWLQVKSSTMKGEQSKKGETSLKRCALIYEK